MFTLTVLGLFISIASSADSADLESEKNLLKQQIISLAKSYEGQGDPDLSKQQSLEPLVQKLLSIAPQSTLKERMGILAGSWRQVWGRYDYKNNDHGVDPELGTEEIYQVISSEGYYYNVSYLYKNGDVNQKRIGLHRGEYQLSEQKVAYSKAILYERGNISSATLPHVWERMLSDSAIKVGTKIISFAFGPGLAVFGSVMEVC